MSPRFKGFAFALASSAAFGLLPAFNLPLLAKGMTTPAVLFYRFLTSTALVGLYLLATRTRVRITRRQWRDLGIFACLPYAGCALCLFLSYDHIASGVATTLHFLYPVLVAAIMAVGFKERWRPLLWIGMGLSIAGVAVLSLSGGGRGAAMSAVGLAEVLLSSVLYATYIVGVNQSSLRSLAGMPLCFLVFSGCTLAYAAYGLPIGALAPPPDLEAVALILGGALVSTLLSNLCLLRASQLVGSTTTAVLGCLESLTAVAVGVLAFGEAMSLSIALGTALVLAAVLWTIRFSARTASPPAKGTAPGVSTEPARHCSG